MNDFILPNPSFSHLKDDMKKTRTQQIANIPKPNDFCGQIYKATCKTSGKSYIGQTRSHIVNRNVYREYGYLKRWQAHVKEAYNPNATQCVALNNAIKQYGENDFDVELIDTCGIEHDDISDLNYLETHYIEKYNTMVPNGYNLDKGGDSKVFTEEKRKSISTSLKKFYESDENCKIRAHRIAGQHDAKRLKKYQNRDDIIDCDVRYLNYPKEQYIEISINFTNNSSEIVMFGRGKYIEFKEACSRTKSFLDQIMKGKQIKIYNTEVAKYFQNN
jgi:hypothetical protein